MRIDPELVAAIDSSAEADHAANSEIIREAIRRLLDVARVVINSAATTIPAPATHGSQPSEGRGVRFSTNRLGHKDFNGTPGGTRTPNVLIRKSTNGVHSSWLPDWLPSQVNVRAHDRRA